MNQKSIGIVLIIIALCSSFFTYYMNAQQVKYIDAYIDATGSCFLEDGTCLHRDRNLTGVFIGIIVSISLLVLGIYLVFFDKTQQTLLHSQHEIAKALTAAKEKDEFKAYLAGFSEDERSILSVIHEEEGIKQSTLRFRTGLSKTTLSLILKSLDERKIVNKKPSGKTNQLYLQRKF